MNRQMVLEEIEINLFKELNNTSCELKNDKEFAKKLLQLDSSFFNF